MTVPFKRRLVKIGGSFRLTIPLEVVQGQGWKEGDEITILANDEIVLKKEKKPKEA